MTKIYTSLIACLCLFLSACDAKVTDPSDPRFDPMQFEFSDYGSNEALIPVLQKLFAPGTKRSSVDKVLIEAGNANWHDRTHSKNSGAILNKDNQFQDLMKTSKSLVLYIGGGKSIKFGGYHIHIFYNDQDEVMQIYVLHHPIFNIQ